MNIRRQGWSFAVALGAAYLLVLQLLLTGMVLGSHAAPGLSGGFDGVICASATQNTPLDSADPSVPASPPHLPDCCQLGCLLGTMTPPPSQSVALAMERPAIARSGFTLARPALRGDDGWHTPQNSRAPPRLI